MPKIVIAAFDGLQRSQVSLERMPVVSALADKGVRFQHNHAVFPTVTRANSASLVTGVTPGKHGLTANKSVYSEYSPTEVVDALIPKLAEINDLTDGGLLFVPTLGELISQKNLKWVSVVGGTSGNAFVQHPNAAKYGDVIIHPEFTNPPEHHSIITKKFGAWPRKDAPAAALVERTADVAIEYALGGLNPDVLLVWFPEPDTSQHAYGIDSTEARQMYSLADANLGKLLESISKGGEEPDVFVVSDHGYSTIDSVIDVHVELALAGFCPNQGARSVVVAENGGSVLLYLPQKNDQLAIDLVDWLYAQEWVGAIATDIAVLAKHKFASISDIGLDGPRSPDVVVTMRSVETGQSAPLERSGAATGGVIGVGSHGGSSPAELHNTLIASGPSFLSSPSGIRSKIASGNIDVAPTVLELLGIPVPTHMEGRILTEALVGGTVPIVSASMNSSEQSPIVRTTTIGEKTYICEFG